MTPETPRIELTTSCRDADDLPKVAESGEIVDSSDGPLQVMASGVRVVAGCYYGDWMTEIIRDLRGHHEPQEEVAFHVMVERLVSDTEAPVMIELGAFWAYYSLWLLERAADGTAILVEPDPHNLAAGRRNFAINGRTGEFVQAAVGREAAPPAPFACESDGRTRDVETVSLASLVSRFDLPRIDMLLVDVQGAETAFLDGGLDLLRSGLVRFAVVSTHHHTISGDPLTHQRCIDLLVGAGGHVIAEHTVAESFSGDGLVAASFDERDKDLRVHLSRARAGASLFGDPLLDLARCSEALAEQSSDLDEVRALLAEATHELAVMRSTATWRTRDRVLASSIGRGAERLLRRARRARVGSVRPA